MENMEPKGEAETVPSSALPEAPALRISGAISYDELMRDIEARNPIIASRRR